MSSVLYVICKPFAIDHILYQYLNWVIELVSFFRGIAKRTLMKTARKAGLKPKESSKRSKYIMPTPPLQRRSAGSIDLGTKERPGSLILDEELSGIVFELDGKKSWKFLMLHCIHWIQWNICKITQKFRGSDSGISDSSKLKIRLVSLSNKMPDERPP